MTHSFRPNPRHADFTAIGFDPDASRAINNAADVLFCPCNEADRFVVATIAINLTGEITVPALLREAARVLA